VADAELAAGECMHDPAVAGAVVGEHALDDDAVAAVEGECATQEGGSGRCSFVIEHLGVGETAVVVDGDVDVFPALLPLVAAVAAVAGDPMPRTIDPAELLDVNVEQFARARSLVANRRLEPASRPSFPMPILARIPDTVESAIPSVSAISAAVNRNRRNLTIASTRSSGVRFATRRGADERSDKPAAPSSR
jgi:hypothetical protein